MNAQPTPWTAAILQVGLLVASGCGPPKEQQAVDAYSLNPEDADLYNSKESKEAAS